jgi:hypothetical protein
MGSDVPVTAKSFLAKEGGEARLKPLGFAYNKFKTENVMQRRKFPQAIGTIIKVPSWDTDLFMRASACGFFPSTSDGQTITMWRQFPDGYLNTNGFAPCES